MANNPLKFSFELSELPNNYKNLPENQLKQAVSKFFSEYFSDLNGEVAVGIQDGYAVVQWFPGSISDIDDAVEKAVDMLSRGQRSQGEAILSELYKQNTDHPDILFNYAMLLSDKGELGRAIEMLARLTEVSPANHRAWNALGVAHMRQGKRSKAFSALKKSYELDPKDPYTLRNLGGLIAKESPEQALPYLENAATALPEDPQAQYGYGLCLKELEKYDEADAVLKKVVEISPYTALAENAKQLRSEIAAAKMRNKSGAQPRMDVVMYCLAALEKFNEMGHEKMQAVTYEIAMLGRNGLDMDNPEPKYPLKSLSGNFTGMQLAAYMYVGLKKIDPNLDAGIDLEKEYKMALDLFNKKK